MVTLRVICAKSLQGERLTYTGNSSRSSNRILIALVVISIMVVAWWAINGGFDEIQATDSDATVVAQ